MVCQGYSPPEGYVPNMSNPLLDQQYGTFFLNISSSRPQLINLQILQWLSSTLDGSWHEFSQPSGF